MTGYSAPECVCGHKIGDHKSAGTRFPHPPGVEWSARALETVPS